MYDPQVIGEDSEAQVFRFVRVVGSRSNIGGLAPELMFSTMVLLTSLVSKPS